MNNRATSQKEDLYGLAVFVTALTLRASHRDHDFQRDMHDITEQIERITMMVLLLAFGGAIVGGLLADIGWRDVLAAAVILLVIRPLAGLLGMYRSKATQGEKVSIAFLGIRGVGSVYYLSYAVNHGDFPDADRLWTIVCLVVFASILIHGLTVTPAMRWLDQTHGRDA